MLHAVRPELLAEQVARAATITFRVGHFESAANSLITERIRRKYLAKACQHDAMAERRKKRKSDAVCLTRCPGNALRAPHGGERVRYDESCLTLLTHGIFYAQVICRSLARGVNCRRVHLFVG